MNVKRWFPLACLLLLSCYAHRDDTTGSMRQLVATRLDISYNDSKPNATLKDFGCDELDFVELTMENEDTYLVTISDEELRTLGGMKGWHSLTVLDLADLARGRIKQ
jgi:acyl carrier protein